MRKLQIAAVVGVVACLASGAGAQSLFRRPAPAPVSKPGESFPGGAPAGPEVRDQGAGQAAAGAGQEAGQGTGGASGAGQGGGVTLKQASLTYVEAPKPRTYELHDIVYIIISETSSQTSQQTLDAKKDASLSAAVNKFPDIGMFLQGNLTNTSASTPIGAVDVTGSSKYKGDGKFQRNDKFTDRIAAKVIDVKPNGTLVLEARKSVGQDNEQRSLVLSGECRREDITDSNTILSSQLAELTIQAHAEGDAKDTASKGILARLVDAIFNF